MAHQTGAALGSYLAGQGYECLGGYPPVIIAAVGVALLAALLAFSMEHAAGVRRPAYARPAASHRPAPDRVKQVAEPPRAR